MASPESWGVVGSFLMAGASLSKSAIDRRQVVGPNALTKLVLDRSHRRRERPAPGTPVSRPPGMVRTAGERRIGSRDPLERG